MFFGPETKRPLCAPRDACPSEELLFHQLRIFCEHLGFTCLQRWAQLLGIRCQIFAQRGEQLKDLAVRMEQTNAKASDL